MSDEKKYPDNKMDLEEEGSPVEGVYAGPEMRELYAPPEFFGMKKESEIPEEKPTPPPMMVVYAGPEYFGVKRSQPVPGVKIGGRPNFCSDCGRKLEPDFKFCPECGRLIGVIDKA